MKMGASPEKMPESYRRESKGFVLGSLRIMNKNRSCGSVRRITRYNDSGTVLT